MLTERVSQTLRMLCATPSSLLRAGRVPQSSPGAPRSLGTGGIGGVTDGKHRFGGSVGLLITDSLTATCGPSSGCASVRESPPHQRSAHEEARLPCSADVSSQI